MSGVSSLLKRPPYRNAKLLADARHRPCQRCGAEDGTVVAAHYQGIGSHRLGKGRGQKPSDAATAPLCRACHEYFDSYQTANDYERGWEFLMLCLEARNQDIGEIL